MTAPASVVYVAYGVDRLDLDWIPAETPVFVVHNDHRLPAQTGRPGVIDLGDGTNLGFGAAINTALSHIQTPRVVLCNPDTRLEPDHFAALVDAAETELVTIPLVEENGVPNSVVNSYWNPPAFFFTARCLGRFAPRGGALRRVVAPLLGGWGRNHTSSLAQHAGSWPLSERWASAAVLSLPTEVLRSVGGFDDSFFLYYEDTDLQQPLARADSTLRLRLADVAPGIHLVGGSAHDEIGGAAEVARHRRVSARTYASRQGGLAWRIAAALVGSHRPATVQVDA